MPQHNVGSRSHLREFKGQINNLAGGQWEGCKSGVNTGILLIGQDNGGGGAVAFLKHNSCIIFNYSLPKGIW